MTLISWVLQREQIGAGFSSTIPPSSSKGRILFDDTIDKLLEKYGGGMTLEEIIIRLFEHGAVVA